MAEILNPGALAGATGAGKSCQANAADNRTVARGKAQRKAACRYQITTTTGDTFAATIAGRMRWALERLRAAGPVGCTPITEPAPRWSHYVFKLRQIGVEIETITEPHSGEFSGHHARYVLRSKVQEGGAA